MKFLNTTRLFLIICACIVVASIAAPYAMADGGGGASGEPGGNCPGEGNYQLVAPKYSGLIDVILGSDGNLWIEGYAEQEGGSGCQAYVSNGPTLWMEFGGGFLDFLDLQPKDIRGACLNEIVVMPCATFELKDLTGVEKMTFGIYSSTDPILDNQPFFTAKIEIMELVIK